MFRVPVETMLPFAYLAAFIGAIYIAKIIYRQPQVKTLLSPIFRRKTRGGWILFLLTGAMAVSDKWESIKSFLENVKKMSPILKFVVDAAHSPAVQLAVFVAGALWIGAAAILASKQHPVFTEQQQSQLQDRRKLAEQSALFQLETNQKADLKLSVIGIDYVESTTELVAHVQFRNDGTKQRTILSATFGYRDPKRVWKNSWEFMTPIAGHLGNVQPIRLESNSEQVETFRVVVPSRVRETSGGIIGLIVNATTPNGQTASREFEILEITIPAAEGTNGIAFNGKRADNISFDDDESLPIRRFNLAVGIDHIAENIVSEHRIPVRYHQAKLTISSGTVHGCRAYLTAINGGAKPWSGNEQLTFSPSEASDSLSKAIHSGVPYWFDVLMVTSGGEIVVCNEHRQWLRLPRLRDIFASQGSYDLTLHIAGEQVPGESFLIRFNWTANWQTSFLTEARPL